MNDCERMLVWTQKSRVCGRTISRFGRSCALRLGRELPIESEAAMNRAATDLLDTAYLAETIASELAAAADHLSKKGNAVVAQALLKEARRHTVQAIRLRGQSGDRRWRVAATLR